MSASLPAGKVLLAHLGIGSSRVRLPLKTLQEAERAFVFDAARKVPLDSDKWQPSHVLGNVHIPLGSDTAKPVSAAL